LSFATEADVVARRGTGALTDNEEAQVAVLLELATGAIAAAVDKTDDWAADLDPVPTMVRLMTVELVVRAMTNPQGLESVSEALGQYSNTQRFRDAAGGGGLELSTTEVLLLRRVVHGRNSGSARAESIVDDLYPYCGS
jgi:hypothetical protein